MPLNAQPLPRAFDRGAVPADALVVLVGPAGCGKSTFARRHFLETQVVSSDECRRLVADDAANQAVNREAFRVFYALLHGRLALGRLTVADATHLHAHTRAALLEIAAEHERPAVAVVFDYPLELCLRRAASRDRTVDPEVIRRHHESLQTAKVEIGSEGFAAVCAVRPAEG